MSGVFYLLSGVSPSTGVFWRCVYGLPILLIVAWREWGSLGPDEPPLDRPVRGRRACASPST